MLWLRLEIGVGHTEAVIGAKLPRGLPVLIDLANSKGTQGGWPRVMVSTYFGIEVANEDKVIAFVDVFDGVVQLRSACQCMLLPVHPMWKADCGRTAPYWLGAAQLKVGGNCPMRCEDLSHSQKQPLVPHSMPIELCSLLPVDLLFQRYEVKPWRVSSPGPRPRQGDVEDQLLPK
ncbi:hypothetical protein AWC38_SpisGene20889 [Stylophora pistillata]|uniref:Uncharacterized protein n=1 Tax=Stylophora pistillata TaxID=50429 RepID=A0A2B4RDM8_STYPI|nr:hypothetical protein AWC38_SpisGene20889 [Stylophora pistillata]